MAPLQEDDLHARVMAEIAEVARAKDRERVLEDFSNMFYRTFVPEQQKLGKSPAEMFARLEAVVDAREEVHDMERSMDKAYFVNLVKSGYFMAGGWDKQTLLPIFWFRQSDMEHNAWTYKAGSPRGNAFNR